MYLLPKTLDAGFNFSTHGFFYVELIFEDKITGWEMKYILNYFFLQC